MDDDRNLMASKDEEKDVWKKYLEKLFHDTRNIQEPIITNN